MNMCNIRLLCRAVSGLQSSNPSLSVVAHVPVSGGDSSELTARLRQRRPDRPPGLSHVSSAVSPQCGWFSTCVAACLWRTNQPSLTACSWTYQVQGCRTRVQGPPRLCTIVPWPIHLRCRPSKSPRISLFLQRLPCSASGHRSTVGSRAFSVAGPQVLNCLPLEITSALSLATFRTRLETFMFMESCPDGWSDILFLYTVYSGLGGVLNT